MEFLPLALGAIFAGNAATRWAAKLVGDYKIESVDSRTGETSGERRPSTNRVTSLVARAIFLPTDTSGKVVVLFLTYLLSCFGFTLISRAVYSNAFKELHASLSIPPDLQFAVVAILMATFVSLSGTNDD